MEILPDDPFGILTGNVNQSNASEGNNPTSTIPDVPNTSGLSPYGQKMLSSGLVGIADIFTNQFGLRISGGNRTPARNAAVGGVSNSWHLQKGNRGAIDAVGSMEQMQKARDWAIQRGAKEAIIHDAGSGLHLHTAWDNPKIDPFDLLQMDDGLTERISDTVRSEQVDPGVEHFDFLGERNIFQTPEQLRDINHGRQSALSTAWGGLVQSAGTLVGGTIEMAGYLLETRSILNILRGVDDEIDNVFIDAGKAIQDGAREFAPIATSNANEAGLFAGNGSWKNLFSGSYWASNAPTILSTLTILVPSMAVGRGVSLLGRGAQLALNTQRGARAIQGANILAQTGASWLMENTQQAKEVYDYAITNGATQSQAGEAAAHTMRVGYATLGLQLAQTASIFRGVNVANRTIATKLASLDDNLVNMSPLVRGAVRYAKRTGDIDGAIAQSGLTRGEFLRGIGFNAVSEGAEEIYQEFAVSEGRYAADRAIALSDPTVKENYFDEKTLSERVSDYLSDPKSWEVGFFGALGGGIYGTAGTIGTTRIYKNDTERQLENLKAIEKQADRVREAVKLSGELVLEGEEAQSEYVDFNSDIDLATQSVLSGTYGYTEKLLQGISTMSDEDIQQSISPEQSLSESEISNIREGAKNKLNTLQDVKTKVENSIKNVNKKVPQELQILAPALVSNLVRARTNSEYASRKLIDATQELRRLEENAPVIENEEADVELTESKDTERIKQLKKDIEFFNDRLQENVSTAQKISDYIDGKPVNDLKFEENWIKNRKQVEREIINESPIVDDNTVVSEPTPVPTEVSESESEPIKEDKEEFIPETNDEELDLFDNDYSQKEDDPFDFIPDTHPDDLFNQPSFSEIPETDPEVVESVDEDIPTSTSEEQDVLNDEDILPELTQGNLFDEVSDTFEESVSDDTTEVITTETTTTEETTEDITVEYELEVDSNSPLMAEHFLRWNSLLPRFEAIDKYIAENDITGRQVRIELDLSDDNADYLGHGNLNILRNGEIPEGFDITKLPFKVIILTKSGSDASYNKQQVWARLWADREDLSNKGVTNEELDQIEKDRENLFYYLSSQGYLLTTVRRVSNGFPRGFVGSRPLTNVKDLFNQVKDNFVSLGSSRDGSIITTKSNTTVSSNPRDTKGGRIYAVYNAYVHGKLQEVPVGLALNRNKIAPEIADIIIEAYREFTTGGKFIDWPLVIQGEQGETRATIGNIFDLFLRTGSTDGKSQRYQIYRSQEELIIGSNRYDLKNPQELEAAKQHLIRDIEYGISYLEVGGGTIGSITNDRDVTILGKTYRADSSYDDFIIDLNLVSSSVPLETNGVKTTHILTRQDVVLDPVYEVERFDNDPTEDIISDPTEDITADTEVDIPENPNEGNTLLDTDEFDIFEDDSFDGIFRAVSDTEYAIADLDKELAWLKKNLPNVPTEIVDDLIRMGSDGFAWGAFADNIIKLSAFMSGGTAYHEAFHAVTQSYLSEEQREAIYKEARDRGAKGNNRQVEEILAEQFRVFVQVRENMSLPDRIKDFFKRIYAWIKSLGSGNDIDLLFYRINSGFYANKIQNPTDQTFYNSYGVPDFTMAQSAEVANHLLYVAFTLGRVETPADLDNFGKHIGQIEKVKAAIRVSKGESREKLEERLAKLEKINLHGLLKAYISDKIKKGENEQVKERWTSVLARLNYFVSEDSNSGYIVDYLEGLGISKIARTIYDTEDTIDGAISSHIVESYEMSFEDRANKVMRLYFNLMPFYEFKNTDNGGLGVKPKEFGDSFLPKEPKMAPPGLVYSKLKTVLQNASPRILQDSDQPISKREEQLLLLEAESKKDPIVKVVYDKLTDPSVSEDFKTSFFVLMNTQSKNFYSIIFKPVTTIDRYEETESESESIVFPNSRRKSTLSKISTNVTRYWAETLKSVDTNTAQQAIDKFKEYQDTVGDVLKTGDTTESFVLLSKAFNILGMNISSSDLVSYIELDVPKSGKSTAEELKAERNISIKKLSSRLSRYFFGLEKDDSITTLNTIAKKGPTEEDIIGNSRDLFVDIANAIGYNNGWVETFATRTSDGKSIYDDVTTKPLYDDILLLRDHPIFFARNRISGAFANGSLWLKKFLTREGISSNLSYQSNLEIEGSDLTNAITSASEQDRLAADFISVIQGSIKGKQASVPLINPSDKRETHNLTGLPTYYKYVVDKRRVVTSDQFSRDLAHYALVEHQRIAELHEIINSEEGIPNPIVNYHPSSILNYQMWVIEGRPDLLQLQEMEKKGLIKDAKGFWKSLGNGVKFNLFPDISYSALAKREDVYEIINKLYHDNGTPRRLDLNNVEEIKRVLSNVTNDIFLAKVEDQLNYMVDLGILNVVPTQGAKSTRDIYYIAKGIRFMSSDIYAEYDDRFQIKLSDKTVSDSVYGMVADFVANTTTANIEQYMLFYGDLALFKSEVNFEQGLVGEDYKKRTGRQSVSGPAMDLGPIPGYFDTTRDSYNVVALKDIEGESEYIKEIEKYIREGYALRGHTGTQLDKLVNAAISPYKKVNKADAQGYTTHTWWRENQIRLGRWSKEHQRAYEILLKPFTDASRKELKELTKKIDFNFQQDKPVNSSNYIDPENDVTSAIYLKYSRSILFPALVESSPILKGLLEKMERSNIQEAVFESGIKVGAKNPQSMDSDTLTPFTIPVRGWRLQVEVNTKGIKTIDRGTQQANNIHANIDYSGNPYDTHRGSMSGYDLSVSIENLWKGLTEKAYNNIKKKLDSGSNLLDLIVDEVRSRGGSIAYLKSIEEGFKDLSLHPGAQNFQSLLLSIFNKRVAKAGTPGGVMVQLSNVGLVKPRKYTEVEGAEDSLVFNYDALKPPHYDSEGNFVPGGILLPSIFKTLIPDIHTKTSAEIKEYFADNPDLLRAVTYRIPNQGKSSIDVVNIAGFLPPEAGDSIVMFDEVTAKTGSDFDVDKMYVMVTSYRVNKETGKPEKIEFDPEKSITEQSVKAISNEIIDYYYDLFADKRTYAEAMTPVDAHTKEAIEISKKLKPLYEGKRSRYDSLSANTYAQNLKDGNIFNVGKSLLGVFASNTPHHALTQKHGIAYTINENGLHDGIPFVKDSFGDIRFDSLTDSSGTYILNTLSAGISGGADVAKDPWISYLGINLETTNAAIFLLRGGVPLEYVGYFLSQPIIRKYVSRKALEKSAIYVQSGRTARHYIKGFLEDRIDKVVDNIKDENEKVRVLDAISINDSRHMSLSRLKESVREQDSPEYWARQKNILEVFEQLSIDGQNVQELVQATKFDVSNIGRSIAFTLTKLLGKQRILAMENTFLGANRLFDNTLHGYLSNVAGEIIGGGLNGDGLLGSYFLEGQSDYINLLSNAFESTMGRDARYSDGNIMEELSAQIKGMAISRLDIYPDQQKIKSMIMGDNTMAQRLERLKSGSYQNLLLDRLFPSFGSIKSGRKEDFINARNISGQDVSIDQLIESWSEGLSNEDPEVKSFFEDLIGFALVTSAMRRGPNTLHEIIPPYILKDISLSIEGITPEDIAITYLLSPWGENQRRKVYDYHFEGEDKKLISRNNGNELLIVGDKKTNPFYKSTVIYNTKTKQIYVRAFSSSDMKDVFVRHPGISYNKNGFRVYEYTLDTIFRPTDTFKRLYPNVARLSVGFNIPERQEGSENIKDITDEKDNLDNNC